MLRLYNSLGRKLEEFKPIEKGKVLMYTCGPTVWNYAHIGNYRTFVFEDLLRRHLRFKGYDVTQVMNITDVEDRIIKKTRDSGKSLQELTTFYEEAFHSDLAILGVQKAERYPRATEHIKEMVALIKTLLDKGLAYKTDDGSVYYDVKKFKDYGALSGVRLDSLKPGGRVSNDYYEEKREAADFALWKGWVPEDGEVFWETELGKGRPGWHIECSAMSMKYLGETFDIHTGGKDHRFPHHENEIAQSVGATGKKLANYWLHSDFLSVESAEMHKSVGNVVYLKELIEAGWEPLTIRLFLVSSKYRDPIDLTDSGLSQAKAQRLRLQELVARLADVNGEGELPSEVTNDFLHDFEEAMDDDLNTPLALASVFSLAKRLNIMMDDGRLGKKGAASATEALAKANEVLGVLDFEKSELPPDLVEMLAQREDARRRKDFAESDRLRNSLLERGIVLEDTPSGTRWKRRA